MNDEVSFVVCFALACALIFSPVGCAMREDALIAEMVKNGADPLDAACAIRSGRSNFCQFTVGRQPAGALRAPRQEEK